MYRTTISILLALLLLLTGAAFAVDQWLLPKEVTVDWDGVSTFSDGTPISAEDGAMEYQVVISAEDKQDPIEVYRGTATRATIDLTTGDLTGNVLIGFKSILVREGQDVAQSFYGWSDDPEVLHADQPTFGFRLYPPVSVPTGVNLP